MTRDWFFLTAFVFFFHHGATASTDWLARSPAPDCLASLPLLEAPLDLGFRGWTRLRFSSEMDSGRLRDLCAAHFASENWEPDRVFRPARNKIRRVESSQTSDHWALEDAKALILPGAAGLPVAIIDTGVDESHPALRESFWRNPGESGIDSQGRPKATNGIDDDGNGFVDDVIGWDFVGNDKHPSDEAGREQGHGTHVAGIIAAREEGARGVRGISPATPLMILRFIDANGYGTTSAAIRSVKYAIDQGARLINVSWGGDEAAITDSRALLDAFMEARSRGVLVIVAAGNGSYDIDRSPERAIPASYRLDNMIVVAASGPGGHRATFSNYGIETVDLAAPGIGILSTIPGGAWGRNDGSSVAVPYVSGALSLVWSLAPRLTAAQLKAALLASVTPTPTLSQRVRTGGRLNVEALKDEVLRMR